jgi:hypothetical protein
VNQPPICAWIRDLLNTHAQDISPHTRHLFEEALVEETLRHAFKVTEEQPHLEPELIGRNGHRAGDI